ncbi:MAG TPA: hypothetical protein VF613_11580 [Longimicrobium sp.]|jgi:hypothetical protein
MAQERGAGIRGRAPGIAKVASAGVKGLLRGVPVRHRFAVMVALARAAASLKKPPPGAPRVPWHADDRVDAMLHQIMARTMARGIEFAPRMYGVGPMERIRERAGQGILCVGPRSSLHAFIVRYLHEQGLEPLPVASYDPYPVLGTSTEIPVLQTGARLMFQARRALGEGRLVLAALGKETGARVIHFDTARGRMDMGDALIRLGLRCGAALCFGFATLDHDGAIALRFEFPDLPAGATPERAVEAYIAAVQRAAAASLSAAV